MACEAAGTETLADPSFAHSNNMKTFDRRVGSPDEKMKRSSRSFFALGLSAKAAWAISNLNSSGRQHRRRLRFPGDRRFRLHESNS
ncbi:MAG: hypothetical protein PHT34_02695 [Oscillospiraceae bacterium]|nr:hypothetical protein [Oscillospiraceae bacterium]